MTRMIPSAARKHLAAAFLLTLFFACLAVAGTPRVWAAKGKLQIYFIDVEGGQSTLFVTPSGQSLLIDTGWANHAGRDADRIVAAAKHAGLGKIDYVLLTHYHGDHTGGVPQLAARIPVGTFIDHGPLGETSPGTTKIWQAYQDVLATGKYKHIVPHPGDVLPISGMKATVVSGDGQLIDRSLPGGGQKNEYCNVQDTWPQDTSENSRSLGLLIDFGKFKLLDMGDLTWDKDKQLMCPVNKLGSVDILVLPNHGMVPSSSHALVDGLHSRVVLMNNGAAKGGTIPALDMVRQAPGLETLWQLHYADKSGEHNTAAEYIANLQGADGGNYIQVTAKRNGSFSVLNSRTTAVKNYPAK